MRTGDQAAPGGVDNSHNSYLIIATTIGWFTICIIQIVGLLSGDKSPMQVKIDGFKTMRKILIKRLKTLSLFRTYSLRFVDFSSS